MPSAVDFTYKMTKKDTGIIMNNATAMTPKMFTFAKATSEMDSFALAKASRGAAAKDNAEVVAAATDLDNCSLFCAINCFVVWEEAYICVVLRVIGV